MRKLPVAVVALLVLSSTAAVAAEEKSPTLPGARQSAYAKLWICYQNLHDYANGGLRGIGEKNSDRVMVIENQTLAQGQVGTAAFTGLGVYFAEKTACDAVAVDDPKHSYQLKIKFSSKEPMTYVTVEHLEPGVIGDRALVTAYGIPATADEHRKNEVTTHFLQSVAGDTNGVRKALIAELDRMILSVRDTELYRADNNRVSPEAAVVPFLDADKRRASLPRTAYLSALKSCSEILGTSAENADLQKDIKDQVTQLTKDLKKKAGDKGTIGD
jgi:hypothetical protein